MQVDGGRAIHEGRRGGGIGEEGDFGSHFSFQFVTSNVAALLKVCDFQFGGLDWASMVPMFTLLWLQSINYDLM